MAVVSVKEQKHLSKSARNAEGRTGTRVFYVKTDDPAYPTVAETASGIPGINDYWPGESGTDGRRVTSISAETMGDFPVAFKVTVDYDNALAIEENPLDRPSELEIDVSTGSEKYGIDATGKPVVNTAYEPFDGYLERDTTEICATYTKNEASLDLTSALSLMNAVNDGTFSLKGQSIGAQAAKVCGFRASEETENGVTYWRKSWVIKLRPRQQNPDTSADESGWYHLVESRGYTELVNVDGTEIPFDILANDDTKKPVTKPYPLDESGAKKPNPSDQPYVIVFKPYTETAYGSTFAS